MLNKERWISSGRDDDSAWDTVSMAGSGPSDSRYLVAASSVVEESWPWGLLAQKMGFEAIRGEKISRKVSGLREESHRMAGCLGPSAKYWYKVDVYELIYLMETVVFLLK